MENIILFSFSFICWIFWLVGWLGAKGSWRTRQVPNKVEWWQCVVQVVTGGPFMPHWQLHSEGAQSFDLCSALSIRDTGSRRTFRITQRFANIVKRRRRKKTLLWPATITINWPLSTPSPYETGVRKTARDCSVFCRMLQILSKEAEGQTNTFCEPAKRFKAMQMRKEENVIAGIKFQSITQLVQLLVRKVKSSRVQGNKGTNDLSCEDPSW